MRIQSLILGAVASLALVVPAIAQDLVAITGGKILTGTSVIENGTVVIRDGRIASVGAGAACLGNPLHALQWLAATMARAGDPLKAGDVVLSGALGPMVPVTPGAAYEARISGLGSVRTCFSKEATS